MTPRRGAALRLHGIRKTFGRITALDGVDLEIAAGEIHALVGENGAGKSTLAAIAAGTLAPSAGSVEAGGAVGLVHQHVALIEPLTVWENIVLGREPRRGLALDRRRARAEVRALGDRYGLPVDPDARVASLPLGMRQRVEILREVARDPAVLLLDEPTAALAPGEIAALFATVGRLAAGGTAVLVVTHKLAEVIAFCSRVTVLRAGRVVASLATAATSADTIARAMVGGEIPALPARAAPPAATAGLRIAALNAAGRTDRILDFALEVGAGEIVGLAGVEGNGQAALVDALAGVVGYSGHIAVGAQALRVGDGPRRRRAAGLHVVPPDRTADGIIAAWTVADNVALGAQHDPPLRRGALFDGGAARSFAADVIARFDVRPPDPRATAGVLSGGNQQKIVVGRALAGRPRAVVAAAPTRGVDLGAATLIGARLIDARNAGCAVLLVSFDLDEILALSDRIGVLFGGRLASLEPRDATDRARIGMRMAGG